MKVDLSGIFASLDTEEPPAAESQGTTQAEPFSPASSTGWNEGPGGGQRPHVAAEGVGSGEEFEPGGREGALSSADAPVGNAEQRAQSLNSPTKASMPQFASFPAASPQETERRARVASALFPGAPLGGEVTAHEQTDSSASGPSESSDPRMPGALEDVVAGFQSQGSQGSGGKGDAEVAQALEDAERVAAGFRAGGVTAAQRRELEAAIERAEAAMGRVARVQNPKSPGA